MAEREGLRGGGGQVRGPGRRRVRPLGEEAPDLPGGSGGLGGGGGGGLGGGGGAGGGLGGGAGEIGRASCRERV